MIQPAKSPAAALEQLYPHALPVPDAGAGRNLTIVMRNWRGGLGPLAAPRKAMPKRIPASDVAAWVQQGQPAWVVNQ